MELIKKYTETSLIIRIVVGLVIGAILGLVVPNAAWIAVFGDIFVGALKGAAPVLVFTLVVSSLANGKSGHGGNMSRVVVLYMVSTLLGALVAVLGSFIFPVTMTLQGVDAVSDTPPDGVASVMKVLLLNMVTNPVQSTASANYIGVLCWAVVIGIALKKANDTTKQTLQDIAEAISQVVRWIINLAPFGIMGLVFSSVSTSGMGIFTEYGKLILLLVCCMAVQALIVNGGMVAFCLRTNPYPLIFKCLKESGVTAFFTRSSAANIPVNMELCKKLGLDKDNYSVSIPLGATINMDGAAITITVMSLAACHTMGISVSPVTAVVLSLIATLSACGASGVAGGSLLLIPLACSLFGVPNDVALQVVGVGFIIGVIQDSCETALNSSSDVLLTATAEFVDWKKEGRKLPFQK